MAKIRAAADKVAKTAAKPARAKSAPAADDDELSALAAAGKECEDEQRAQTGSQNSFITLVKANSGVLDKNAPSFIKGVKALDFAVTSKKLRLGPKLDATILGHFKVYAEVKKKEKDSEMPTTVGFWMPEQACQFEISPGAIFDRELPNGNILQPVHWVFLYLHDFPDIEDGLLAFRSKGNKIYSDLEKLIKAESSFCTELRFAVTHQDIYNEKYKKTDYYPSFEITGRNYKYQDGRVIRDKNGLDAETLKEILTRYKKIQEDYKAMRLVAKRDVAALLGPPKGRAALPAGKDGEYEEDDAAEDVRF
jgi:hypothetical protein